MRAFFWMLLVAGTAAAETRTWTIARDMYTADAELVAVRGDTALLRIDGKVESVPLSRLSAADQQYIATLTLGPLEPVRFSEPQNPAPISSAGPEIPSPTGDVLPIPGEEHSLIVPTTAVEPVNSVPTTAPSPGVAGEESLPRPPGQIAAPWPQQPAARTPAAGAATWPPANNRRPPDAEADRRFWRQQQQQQQNNRARNLDDDDDDDAPRGFRARFFERRRGTAQR